MVAHLTLGVLGAMQVTLADGETAKFRSDQTRALLAYLAVEADRPHRREALTGLLWPDEPEETARHNLRQALVNLRRTIGDSTAHPPYLLIDHHEIQFNLASDFALDVADFEADLSACASHPHARLDACAICAPRLQQAIDLYRGEFLQEFFLKNSAAFEEWALARREACRHRALEALSTLATYYEQHGDLGATRRCALRALELDPWREQAHRQIMRVYALEGQYGAALAQYETCRRVLAEEMDVEPSTETRELYERIRAGNWKLEPKSLNSVSPSNVQPPASNLQLPTYLTPFVGRERELAQLHDILAEPGCRLVTLVGPGGIGKTRLAVEAASHMLDVFADGMHFVPLASANSMRMIVPAIADSVGLAFHPASHADPKTQLFNNLKGKHALLLLDNLEQLLTEPGIELLAELLAHAPHVKLMVTSRESLGLHNEWVFEVQGLPIPDNISAEGNARRTSVELFVQRARRSYVGFEAAREDYPAIIRICQLVDGNPLGIELAAAWVRTLSCGDIAQEIERGMDFLSVSARDLPTRHRSMRVVFDHSWQLLAEEEQAVLLRLSVFRGGFSREAAELVAGATLSVLSILVTKSLIHRSSGGRYELHELVRQYAASRLKDKPEDETAACLRHAEYYIDYAARQENHLQGARQLEALADMTTEMENIRLGWRFAVTQQQIQAIHRPIRAVWSFYEMRGRYQEAEALFGWAGDELQRTRGTPAHSDPSYQVLVSFIRAEQGWFSVRLGKREEARELLESNTAILRSLGAKIERVHALHHLGVLEWQAGNYLLARTCYQEELDLATQIHDRWEMAMARGNLAMAAQALGERHEALEQYQAALAAYRSLEDPRMVSVGLFYLGALQCEMGMYAAAQAPLRESIALSRRVGEPWLLGMALSALGNTVAQSQGDVREAIALFQESLALFEQVGERWSTVESLNQLGSAALTLGDDDTAREAFLKALNLAKELELLPGILAALIGIAHLQIKKDQRELALVVVYKVLDEPSILQALRGRADGLRIQAEQYLAPEQIQAAHVQARAKNMSDVVELALRQVV